VKRSELSVGAVVLVQIDRGRPPKRARVVRIDALRGQRGQTLTYVVVRLVSGSLLRVAAVRILPLLQSPRGAPGFDMPPGLAAAGTEGEQEQPTPDLLASNKVVQ
jgi:hypothetical protein